MMFRIINLFVLYAIIVSSLVLDGCSTSRIIKTGGTLNLFVQTTMMDVWVNLMPGTNGPKLHVLGEANVKNLSNESIRNLIIRNIEVFQKNEFLFSFTPNFNEQNVTGSLEFLSGEIRLYAFGTKTGLALVNNLNLNQPISFLLEFSSGGKNYYARVEDINIRRVY